MPFVDAHDPRLHVREASEIVSDRWGKAPDLAVVAGSGFSALRSLGTILDVIPYQELPGFSQTSVVGHGSDLCLIEHGSQRIALFTGRLHLYEGYPNHHVCQQLALMQLLGCTSVLLTNACGGLHAMRTVGDIVVVSDLLNWTFRSVVAMPHALQRRTALDEQWQASILATCSASGVPVHRGVFVQMLGPSYETRAEIRMLRRFGADIVGMSSAVEARWAASHGMRVAMMSLVTNTLTDTTVRHVSHTEVIEASNVSEDHMVASVRCAIEAHALHV